MFPAASLLSWFDAAKRPMPWRGAGATPYRVWISEIMLQQTQVDKVIPYFARFVARFPDARALAAAPEAQVLEAWAGLGYYSRARQLHRAARVIGEAHGGELPLDTESWAALPGIGPYTLGAIRSIAYGEPRALVDGNVVRVLARVFGWRIRRGDATGERRVWRRAEALIQTPAARTRPGDFNQALMELGATVCVPATPSCHQCPLRARCVATATKTPARYPFPKRPVRRARLRLLVAWLEQGAQVLTVRRPARGLWAGMLALPAVEIDASQAKAGRALTALLRAQGVRAPVLGRELARSQRTLTHRDVELVLLAATARSAPESALRPRSALASMPSAFVALSAKAK